MAYEDEIAAANRLPTREARLAARNAVRAKYGMASEEKRRGGLAGFYDRNKQLIQAGLPTLAGMFIPGGGALAGAITGGLARGLDRPGQGGVALNLGQAARGAATGAALGSLGEKFSPFKPAAPTPLRELPAPTGPSATTAQTPMGMAGPARGAPATPAPTVPSITPAPTPMNMPVPDTKPGMMSRLLTTVQKPEVLAPLAGGVADVIGSAQDRAVRERQLALEEERMRRERESQERLAQLLMPLFQQTASQYGRTR